MLLAALVIDVWLGVASRYLFDSPFAWTEELARYLMIWMALLAGSSAIVRREHIGLNIVKQRLSHANQRHLVLFIDALGMVFFFILFWFGLQMTQSGLHQYANIFGMTMALPFAAVPVASFLSVLQLGLRAVDDYLATTPPAEKDPLPC